MLRPEGTVGRYEIQRRVATGGMGALYLARDPVLDRTVALKLFHSDLDQPHARDRFVGEARAVAALNHPNIVTIYDYGEYQSQPFLVMEYIQGETLADVIHRKVALPFAVMVRWMEDVCAAVGYAHERGIIHRDIKPANLMVDAYGRIKVLDFGIARMRGTLASRVTAMIGTPGYVAPEQIEGGPIDHRSDLFSIGVLCYELFSHTEPFGGPTPHAVTHRTLHEDPPPLETLRPEIDPDLSAIVTQALQKGVEARVQQAAAFRDALAAVRRRLEAAEPETIIGTYKPPAVPEAGSAGAVLPGGLSSRPPTDSGQSRAHRRTTREMLASHRDAQVQGWLDLAQEHLQAGERDEAREACTQVLRLQPGHPGAQRLLDSLGQLETGATVLVASAAAAAPPAAGDPGKTVLVPAGAHSISEESARGPRSGIDDPVTSPAPPVSPVVDAPTVLRPARRPADTPVPRGGRGGVTAPVARPATKDQGGRRWRIAPAQAIVLGVLATAAAAAVGWLFTPSAVPVAPVVVVIDAVPWATVIGIEREGGDSERLPADASTPLALSLLPGDYRVSLVGPPSARERRQIAVRVDGGAAPAVVLERFRAMTVDEYFEGTPHRDAPEPETPPATSAPGGE